ncbi:hypothetical protein [Polyangium sp. 15x6]|uniref:hypothetical protein n=1 Tax=Polyangium sp. 15x6 TaxID=3042687 RepID=UPI00249CDC33|nr:hypothetical protein [Polyangium sp. 15x6]MDI3284465.1 hypothetical protein [Polyangium sp. 15x6]
MRRASLRPSWFALIAVSALVFGCAAKTSGTFGAGGEGGEAGQGGSAGSGGQGGSAGQGGAGGFDFPTDGGTPDPELPGEVFGHSPDRLYKLEPYTKQVSVVDYFQGCGEVIDIAIDKDSKIVGTSFSGLYWIDKTTAKCTEIASGSYPNSLSFVPAGTLDPNNEVLVGYQNSTYVRIDTTTGQMTTVGSIGGGYSSSGDIVSVKGGGTYLTVKGNSCNDCLVEVNPKTGALIKNWGSVPYEDVFGIAFWAGSVYGFSDSGQLFEVTFNPNGTGITTKDIPIPGGSASLVFWGAGSTTFAPVEPPPK